MPIYEYQCPKCGRIFEDWVKSSESHKEEPCPECGTSSPRIMSRTSFVLKGDGWYVSDYGYRKGITDDGGAGAEAPVAAGAVSPAPQADKSVAKLEDAPKKTAAKKASGKPAKADSAKASGADSGSGPGKSSGTDSGKTSAPAGQSKSSA